jgi:hypothetical protein
MIKAQGMTCFEMSILGFSSHVQNNDNALCVPQ